MVNENRRRYVKPAMESVSLVPGEAVLGACKTDSGGGQGKDLGSGVACNLIGQQCSADTASS